MKYIVTLVRVERFEEVVEVEADSPKAAKLAAIALDDTGRLDWQDLQDSALTIQSVEPA